nr:MAG TPA: hypothetical protein [Caudoviricetes sp.]
MTEPTLASQFFGLVTIITCLFIALLLIANSEQKARAKKKAQEEHDRMIIEVYQQGRNQFNNIARMNIRNCDRKFTFDEQPLETLDDRDLTADELKIELQRSKQMVAISGQILQAGQLALDAEKFKDKVGEVNAPIALLEG